MRKTKQWLALLLAGGLILTACGSGGGNETTAAGGASQTTAGSQTTSQTTAEPTTNAGFAGVDNDLQMNVEGDEIDYDKVLTTFISEDGTEAFNGNPFDTTSGIQWSILDLVFGNLAFYSPHPEPGYKLDMLESYTWEDGELELKLLDGLKWSDGSVLDADDLMTKLFCNFMKLTYWGYIKSIEKVDNLTVHISMSTTSPLVIVGLLGEEMTTPDDNPAYRKAADAYKALFEDPAMREYNEQNTRYQLTDAGTEAKTAIDDELLQYKPDVITETVYSGPYVITANNTAEVIFAENPHFRKEQKIKNIRGLRGGNSQAYATAILGQEFTIENGGINVDMANQIDEQFKDTLRKIFVPEGSQIGYCFNMTKYPLDRREVRQAIAMAVDTNVLASVGEPGSFAGNKYNSGILPSIMNPYVDDAYLNSLIDYSYNPDKAAEILQSIGWTKQGNMWVDENGESPEISIQTISSWPSFMMTAEAMSAMLTDFGFNINFEPLEFGVWNDRGNNDDFMLICCFVGGASTYGDPYESFNNVFIQNTKGGWPKFEAGQERIFTDSKGVEHNATQIVAEMFQCEDQERKIELTREMMTLCNDLCPYISVIEKAAPLRVYDPTLHMAEANPNGVERSLIYYSNLNTVVAKMLLDDEIYFVKE